MCAHGQYPCHWRTAGSSPRRHKTGPGGVHQIASPDQTLSPAISRAGQQPAPLASTLAPAARARLGQHAMPGRWLQHRHATARSGQRHQIGGVRTLRVGKKSIKALRLPTSLRLSATIFSAKGRAARPAFQPGLQAGQLTQGGGAQLGMIGNARFAPGGCSRQSAP